MNWPALIKTALCLTAATVLSIARPAAAQEGPTRIAVANTAKIISATTEWQDLKKAEVGQLDQLKQQQDGKTRELQELKKKRDDFSRKGTPDYTKATDELMQKSTEVQVWAATQQQVLTRRNKEMMKAQYDKLRGAIAQIAAQRKFDLVINDVGGDLPDDVEEADAERLRQIILQKNVLFAGKGVDISDDVITLLNANYKAGAGAPSK